MEFKYLVRKPKAKTENPPLLILLHGVGSNEYDLFSFAQQLPDQFLVISARGPIMLEPASFAWYQVDFSSGKPVINKEQEEKSREAIARFIDQLKEKHSFDQGNVFLCGFSQGAIMSYSVALTHPDKVKGIVAMSGRLLGEVRLMVNPNKVQHLNILITHGTQDNVLGVQYARESKAFLEELGLKPEYREHDYAHGINEEMFTDLLHWLNKVSSGVALK